MSPAVQQHCCAALHRDPPAEHDNCSSTFWVNSHEKRTFVTYVQQSGYTTAYFGKYLNKYDGNR